MTMIVYSKTALPIQISELQDDLNRMPVSWRNHFNTAHYNGNWSAFPLRTPGGTDTILPETAATDHFEHHSNMKLFPSVQQLLQTLKCKVMSVRLLKLSAGSTIKQHRDNELAFEKGEARLHVPIFTNPDVEFYINEERVMMREGECWYINANLPHRVNNNGCTDRIHLVIDCKVNDWLRDSITAASVIAYAPDEDYPPEVLLQIIQSLKNQRTEASSQLADDLQQRYNTLTGEHQ